MSLNSFRCKMALLSGLLTGALFLVAGVVLWRVSYQFNLDRLDNEIRNLGQGNLDRVQGGDHWSRLEEALKFVSPGQPKAFVLWVKNYDKVVYQSPDWPAGLAPEKLELPNDYAGPNAPKPGEPPPPPPRRGEEISARNPALPLKLPQFFTQEAGGKAWRVGVLGNPYVTLVLAANMDEFNARMGQLRNAWLGALVLMLLLVPAGAWFVAGRALVPVTALTHMAERVTARGLDQRIPAMTGDREFNRLVQVFNEMLDRLEKSFQQATRFSADASHELKTPLARLQAELEEALQQAPSGSSQQETCSSLLEEVSRLKAIVEKLLLLSLADAGRLRIHCQPVGLTEIMANIVEDCRGQAADLAIQEALAKDVSVSGDPELLEQALQNLASNAIKYNQPGGRIRFDLEETANAVVLRISNTGPGITAAEKNRIFERFYRGDKSRSARVEGVGLGLALAREIFHAHRGEILLEESPEGWTSFRVTLPRVDRIAESSGDRSPFTACQPGAST